MTRREMYEYMELILLRLRDNSSVYEDIWEAIDNTAYNVRQDLRRLDDTTVSEE